MIDWKKPLRRVGCGTPVRVLATDMVTETNRPVLVAILNTERSLEEVYWVSLDGKGLFLSVENAPERISYFHPYFGTMSGFGIGRDSLEEAQRFTNQGALEVVKEGMKVVDLKWHNV